MKRAVDELQSKGKDAAGAMLSGDPRTVILDRAKSIGADFLIVGSHGASAITRFLLGNVAATVLQHAPCSVEVVRAGSKVGDNGKIKVLLATDGSEYSERAAQSIAERPWPAGTEVRILSAVQLILPTTRALFAPPFLDSSFVESARAEAMKRSQDAVAQAAQILSSTGLSVSESISVLLETPRAIILGEAERWGADLIVVGSHGRHGVDRFLLGSVSEGVATQATCSVEVIRKSG